MVIMSSWHREDNLMQIVAMINNNFKDSKCHIFKGAPPILNLQFPADLWRVYIYHNSSSYISWFWITLY